MATSQITAKSAVQRTLQKIGSNYTDAHDSANGTFYSGTAVGQAFVSPYYYIRRRFMTFDISTAEIPDNALIQSAYIRLTYTINPSTIDTHFQIIIKKGNPLTYPHYPIDAGDYDYTKYISNGGNINTEDIPDAEGGITRFNIPFNYTGMSWISFSDTDFGIALFSSRDVSSTVPTGGEMFSFADDNSYPPDLFITYFTPTGIPTVGDPTYSNTKATYTKATANVTDAGGGYEERGFEYGLSEVATWAVRETGVWGATGSYSLVLPDLLPEITYYVRAYVTNEYGTGYSDWTSFTTTDVPSYGIYEEPNAATICFYVRRTGGKWSIKHGPYTSDQADIEIAKILTEGKGKYQIKFTSDVLTGLSVNIMTKLDIKAR